MRTALSALVVLTLSGCVQLVAFEQPVIGQPDIVESPAPSGELVCDEDVALGATALCDASCVIEGGAQGERCDGRVTVEGDRVTADVSGLHEVELTLTVCGAHEEPFVLVTEGGSAVAVQQRALAVGPSGGAPVYQHPTFLPPSDDDDGCVDRTLILQAGRMELAEAGQRLCSATLPDFARPWRMRLGGEGDRGLRTVELCLRNPR